MKYFKVIIGDEHKPPATRADCASIARPCNRYLCRNNLTADILSTSKYATGDELKIPIKVTASCALDFVDERFGETSKLIDVAQQFNTTRELVRQIENRALAKADYATQIIAAVDALRPTLVAAGCVLTWHFPKSLKSGLLVIDACLSKSRPQFYELITKAARSIKRTRTVTIRVADHGTYIRIITHIVLMPEDITHRGVLMAANMAAKAVKKAAQVEQRKATELAKLEQQVKQLAASEDPDMTWSTDYQLDNDDYQIADAELLTLI